MSLSEVGLADLKAGTPPAYETAAGAGSGWRMSAAQLSAFASCARQIGEPLPLVLRAASSGRLGDLIVARSGRIAERRNRRAHLARVDILHRRSELAAKQVPSWA
jgi:hypothetical protein